MLSIFFSMIDQDEDREKFEKIYKSYNKLMHFLANQILHDDMLSEDAVQESLLKIAKNIKKLEDADSSHTKYFVVVIAKNTAKNILRKANQTRYLDDLDATRFDNAEEANPEDAFFERIEKAELVNLAMELPESYLEPLILFYSYEYKMPEIAELLGISKESVKKRVQRARKMLVEKYEEMRKSE